MDEVRVFRGIGITRGLERVVSSAVIYLGVLAVLWALGFAVRGWQGWLLVLAPLLAWIGARVWAWHRVSVEIDGDTLRYEGASPRDDFEIAISSIRSAYFDGERSGELVLVAERDHHCAELSPRAARELAEHLGLHAPSAIPE